MSVTQAILGHMGYHKYMSTLRTEKEKWPKTEVNIICMTTPGRLRHQADAGLFLMKTLNLFKIISIG